MVRHPEKYGAIAIGRVVVLDDRTTESLSNTVANKIGTLKRKRKPLTIILAVIEITLHIVYKTNAELNCLGDEFKLQI